MLDIERELCFNAPHLSKGGGKLKVYLYTIVRSIRRRIVCYQRVGTMIRHAGAQAQGAQNSHELVDGGSFQRSITDFHLSVG